MWISLFVNKKIQPSFIFLTIQGMFFDLNPPLPPIPSVCKLHLGPWA